MMLKKIGLWLLLAALLVHPAALAQPTTAAPTPTPAATPAPTKAPLIPETVDVGLLNGFDPLNLWPWQSLRIEVDSGSEPAYIDILVEDEALDSEWLGLDTRRLEAEGLTRQDVAPLLALTPDGWGGLLTLRHDRGEIQGSMVSGDGWHFERFLPQRFRLVVYMPRSGEGFVTEPITVRQHQGLVRLNLKDRSAWAPTNTYSGLWRLKLALRLLAALGLTMLAILPFIDRDRRAILLVKLCGSLLNLLLVLLLPGLFAGAYLVVMILLQLLLSAAEAAFVYFKVTDRELKPALIYGGCSLVSSLLLGIWWIA